MNENYEKVLTALKTVQDPDLKKDLVTLGMIKNLKVDDNKCSFAVELTTPACPLKEKIKTDCLIALSKVLGEKYKIEILMTANTSTSRQFSKDDVLKGVKNIIAIASAKGGVGKSTVASNIAIELAKAGAKVGLIDADVFGPSMPTLFDCVGENPTFEKRNGKSILHPIEKHGIKLMSIGFLAPETAAIVWRGPMASSALKQFITDVEWGELDYLLIDLPPGTSDIHITITQSLPLTGAVVVTTPQLVALKDVKKGIAMFKQEQINVSILGIVENMAYFTPKELPENKYYIFGKNGGIKLSEEFNIPFLGEVPIVQGIRESGDNGMPISMKGESIKYFENITNNLVRNIAITVANKKNNKK